MPYGLFNTVLRGGEQTFTEAGSWYSSGDGFVIACFSISSESCGSFINDGFQFGVALRIVYLKEGKPLSSLLKVLWRVMLAFGPPLAVYPTKSNVAGLQRKGVLKASLYGESRISSFSFICIGPSWFLSGFRALIIQYPRRLLRYFFDKSCFRR